MNRRGPRQRMEIRFPPGPYCRCGDKLTLCVVQTIGKASLGRSYYSCRQCSFFRWAELWSAIWVPSGEPVRPIDANTEREDYLSTGDEFLDVLEASEVASAVSNGANFPSNHGCRIRFWKIVSAGLLL